MPEVHVLYAVTAVVVVGLVLWVAVVLLTAKEPWARPPAPATPAKNDGHDIQADDKAAAPKG